jgi:hypothetical protein
MTKKIDTKTIRLIPSKKKAEVKDPPRFPNIINPIEKVSKINYTKTLSNTMVEITKEMVKYIE